MTTAPIVPYFVGVLFVSLLAHRYLWMRLVRDTALEPRSARAFTFVLGIGTLTLPLGMLGLLFMRVLPLAIQRPLSTTVFTYAGVLYFLLLALLSLELRRVRPRPARANAKRALLACATLSAFSIYCALCPPRDHRVNLFSPRVPAALAGYRIVQLSDLHVGPTLGRDFVVDVVARTNAVHPQLVVITGDLVDGSPDQLLPLLTPLRELRAQDGVFMVLGNHEYLSGAEAWRAALPSLGIRVLDNEAVRLSAAIDLIGVDDETPDLRRAFASRDARRSAILLTHRPSIVDAALAYSPTLVLAGHTHGGQLFPLHLLEWLDQRYLVGQYQLGETILYVSPGAGFWGPPMRLGSFAELSALDLYPARLD